MITTQEEVKEVIGLLRAELAAVKAELARWHQLTAHKSHEAKALSPESVLENMLGIFAELDDKESELAAVKDKLEQSDEILGIVAAERDELQDQLAEVKAERDELQASLDATRPALELGLAYALTNEEIGKEHDGLIADLDAATRRAEVAEAALARVRELVDPTIGRASASMREVAERILAAIGGDHGHE